MTSAPALLFLSIAGCLAVNGVHSWRLLEPLTFYSDIKYKGKDSIVCNGQVLDSRWVFAQASCLVKFLVEGVLNPNDIEVKIFANQETPGLNNTHMVDQVFLHPKYEGIGKVASNDLGLIYLKTPLNVEPNEPHLALEPSAYKNVPWITCITHLDYSQSKK